MLTLSCAVHFPVCSPLSLQKTHTNSCCLYLRGILIGAEMTHLYHSLPSWVSLWPGRNQNNCGPFRNCLPFSLLKQLMAGEYLIRSRFMMDLVFVFLNLIFVCLFFKAE